MQSQTCNIDYCLESESQNGQSGLCLLLMLHLIRLCAAAWHHHWKRRNGDKKPDLVCSRIRVVSQLWGAVQCSSGNSHLPRLTFRLEDWFGQPEEDHWRLLQLLEFVWSGNLWSDKTNEASRLHQHLSAWAHWAQHDWSVTIFYTGCRWSRQKGKLKHMLYCDKICNSSFLIQLIHGP